MHPNRLRFSALSARKPSAEQLQARSPANRHPDDATAAKPILQSPARLWDNAQFWQPRRRNPVSDRDMLVFWILQLVELTSNTPVLLFFRIKLAALMFLHDTSPKNPQSFGTMRSAFPTR